MLHSLFWQNLTPKGGGRPEGELARRDRRSDFGSFEKLKRQLTAAASTIMGSGWGALVWEPLAGRLMTTQIYDHQSNLAQAGVPLLVLDAWEHAYYLQYQNRKTDFFEAVWNVWNWKDVAERFAGGAITRRRARRRDEVAVIALFSPDRRPGSRHRSRLADVATESGASRSA